MLLKQCFKVTQGYLACHGLDGGRHINSPCVEKAIICATRIIAEVAGRAFVMLHLALHLAYLILQLPARALKGIVSA